MALIYGTQSRNQIEGTNQDDVIYGWRQGGDPNTDLGDTLNGNNGDDRMYGGGGDDELSDRDGNDLVSGGIGNDDIYGYKGNDTYYGGGGNDWIYDSEGDDRVQGGSGNDTVDAGWGFDSIYGGSGDDLLSGDYGFGISFRDMFLGGRGNDTIYAGVEVDTLTGGEGSDTFGFRRIGGPAGGTEPDQVVDFTRGEDQIEISRSGSKADFALGTLSGNDFFSGSAPQPQGTDDAILYDTDTGRLFFDANGQVAGGRTPIATLQGAPELRARDFVIVESVLDVF
jgi:Ca2+-binding RTX toxin-like protein